MSNKLYGAILGDLAGQPYEYPPMQKFPEVTEVNLHNPDSTITDDTLMTLAIAKAILEGTDYAYEMKDMGRRYPGDYFGKRFNEWINYDVGISNDSFGNGCIMRISPFMYMGWDKNTVLTEIIRSCVTSHNHQISIKACLDLFDLYEKCTNHLWLYQDNRIKVFNEF